MAIDASNSRALLIFKLSNAAIGLPILCDKHQKNSLFWPVFIPSKGGWATDAADLTLHTDKIENVAACAPTFVVADFSEAQLYLDIITKLPSSQNIFFIQLPDDNKGSGFARTMANLTASLLVPLITG